MSSAATILRTAAEKERSEGIEWEQVAKAGKILADSLRSDDLRVALGEAELLESCGTLLRKLVESQTAAEASPSTTEGSTLQAQLELVRVVGNMCFEHDENRQRTLDAGIPLSVAALLGKTLAILGQASDRERELSIDELKFARAAAGAFLNSSLKFDPMRRELARVETLRPLLALLDVRPSDSRRARQVYTVGEWAAAPLSSPLNAEDSEERMQIGSTAVRWAANVLEDVLAEDKTAFPLDGVPVLASVALSFADVDQAILVNQPDEAEDCIDTDIELLTISTSLLEGICLESDDVKAELAFATYDSQGSGPQSTLLHQLLDFIERAEPPTYWRAWSDDAGRTAKAFAAIKASIVRAVVETPNSDEVMRRLWAETRVRQDGADDSAGQSWLVERLVRWLRDAKVDDGREDLLICAAHMLASLGRKDDYTLALVNEYGLAGPLSQIVRDRVAGAIGKTGRPGETTQILFGVISLLRHLAIPLANRDVIGQEHLTPFVAQLLRPELDVVQPLQLASVGLLKHLSYPSLTNALQLCTGLFTSDSDRSPLDELLLLVERVDDVRLRSEATRVAVNAIRAVFGPSSAAAETNGDLASARSRLSRADVATAISDLVRTSTKHPMLVNEGIVALALLAASHAATASAVLEALLRAPQRGDSKTEPLQAGSVQTVSAQMAPIPASPEKYEGASAAAALATLFAREGSDEPATAPAVPDEMLSNVVNLLLVVSASASADQIAPLEELLKQPLQAALAHSPSQPERARSWQEAASRLLQTWSA